jgi:hypothetical protein
MNPIPDKASVPSVEQALAEAAAPILLDPAILKIGEWEFDDDFAVKCAWGAHGYATGMEPFYSAQQLQAAMRAAAEAATLLSAPRTEAVKGVPGVVYEASNRTFSALFASKEEAEQVAASFGATVGLTVSPRQVLGDASLPGEGGDK